MNSQPPAMRAAASAVSELDMANAIRALAMDAVQKANSGHPGMPMGMADAAAVLFNRFIKIDPSRPDWPDRDRFVLSAGHGSMLQYALHFLLGYEDMPVEQLQRFRQLGSRTAGHPEYGHALGIETTTGPLGQGIATAVGMALAERMLAARFGDGPRRSPYLCDRRRRLPAGGSQPRGDRPCRPSRAGAADRALGRQPHLHRRPHLPVNVDGPAGALPRRRLECRPGRRP